MSIKIAVVQQQCRAGMRDENLSKALAFAKEALSNGAQVILFPEEILLGYSQDMQRFAEEYNGEATQSFAQLLKGTRAIIIYGLTEYCDEKYYISSVVVNEDGMKNIYRKTHLWRNAEGLRRETDYFTPGDELVVMRYEGMKAGLMICYDGDFPEMSRSYAKLNCDMIFWMNNRGQRGPAEVVPLAKQNSMIIASACVCGPDENGNWCSGKSNIVDAEGNVLCMIENDEGVIYAQVEPAKSLPLRRANPLYNGLREDLYI